MPTPNPVVVAAAPEPVVPANTLPLGSQSVLAGQNTGGMTYVPVPIVTVPDSRRAPLPPQAPQPNRTLPQMAGNGQALLPNAFNTEDQLPQMQGPVNRDHMVNAFSPADPGLSGSSGALANNRMPANMMAGRPGMMPPAPFGGAAQPQSATAQIQMQPMPTGVVPALGQVPASQPYAQPVRPASMQQMARLPMAAELPLTGTMTTPQLLGTLKDSLYPSQREWAVEQLSSLSWKTHADVLMALLTAAREDPAATVRASCVRCLGKMKANCPPAVATLQGLKSDSDPRVQREVEQALSMLGGR